MFEARLKLAEAPFYERPNIVIFHNAFTEEAVQIARNWTRLAQEDSGDPVNVLLADTAGKSASATVNDGRLFIQSAERAWPDGTFSPLTFKTPVEVSYAYSFGYVAGSEKLRNDFPRHIRFDLVHQFHCFYNAEGIPFFNNVPFFDERLSPW